MKINYYDRLYSIIYILLSQLGNYDLGFKAMMLFSAMIFAHIITVLYFICDESDLGVLTTYYGVGIIGLPILIFNYFYFVFKSEHNFSFEL